MNATEPVAVNGGRQRRRQLLAIIREFRDATDALPDAVVVLDGSDQIIWSNPAAARLLGLGRHQYRGRPITDLLQDPKIGEWLGKRRSNPNGLIIDSPQDPAIKLRLRVFHYGSGNQHILLCARTSWPMFPTNCAPR
jgi:two-component system phosphate regulon sensor histidine kinase PhoR